jgi:hypothetical protein
VILFSKARSIDKHTVRFQSTFYVVCVCAATENCKPKTAARWLG